MIRSARILVVEGDRVGARDIQQQLRRIGHDVLGTAASGEHAVALENRPDLVLMDIRLEGDIDGVAAASRIREHRAGRFRSTIAARRSSTMASPAAPSSRIGT